MNHHDFASQRFSPLEAINRSNVKNLKLAFAVALGGTSANEYLEATPLVDDGFMYITDVWGVVYKIDVRSGTHGRIVWKMDPGQEKPDRNRGVALWSNLVISVTGLDGRVIATDKETGKIVWDKKLLDQAGLEITAAPLALKDSIIIGASGGDNGTRNWIASLDAKTGDLQWKTFVVPAPGEPGSETWKDKVNAWQTGGGALLCHRLLRSADEPDLLGHGQSGAALRFRLHRPGDNLFHRQHDRVRCRDRQDGVVLPAYGQRQSRLRLGRLADHRRRQGQRRGPQAARSRQPQRLPLHARPPQRPVPQGGAVFRQGHLDQGHRPQDRQAGRLRSRQGRAELRHRLEGRHRRAQERLPGRAWRHQLLAAGLQPDLASASTSPATKAAPTSRPTRRRT